MTTQHIMEQQIQLDPQIQQMADSITSLFSETFRSLLERRDKQYADAIVPLDAERTGLVEEHASIGEAAENLRALLLAKEREAQREADRLMVSGQLAAAREKITEMEQARHAPAVMAERQQEISARIHEIDAEKKAIAKGVFEEWYGQLQPVVRAGERGLFLTLLGGLEQSFYGFQDRTNTGTSDNRTRPLIHSGHISGLTADGRSPEWEAGSHWYGGRR